MPGVARPLLAAHLDGAAHSAPIAQPAERVRLVRRAFHPLVENGPSGQRHVVEVGHLVARQKARSAKPTIGDDGRIEIGELDAGAREEIAGARIGRQVDDPRLEHGEVEKASERSFDRAGPKVGDGHVFAAVVAKGCLEIDETLHRLAADERHHVERAKAGAGGGRIRLGHADDGARKVRVDTELADAFDHVELARLDHLFGRDGHVDIGRVAEHLEGQLAPGVFLHDARQLRVRADLFAVDGEDAVAGKELAVGGMTGQDDADGRGRPGS